MVLDDLDDAGRGHQVIYCVMDTEHEILQLLGVFEILNLDSLSTQDVTVESTRMTEELRSAPHAGRRSPTLALPALLTYQAARSRMPERTCTVASAGLKSPSALAPDVPSGQAPTRTLATTWVSCGTPRRPKIVRRKNR
jgi:hypothetical protein